MLLSINNTSDFFLKSEIAALSCSKTLLLVSGGPDSVFLFHLFVKFKKKHGVLFDVIHFNHHLRGKESDSEQEFVEDLCKDCGIPCVVQDLHFDQKCHLQNMARKRRYQNAFKLAGQKGYRYIMTAHHKDDLLETLVMKKGRGTGVKGLCGIRRMRAVKGLLFKQPVTLLRPLLNISKDEILTWLESHQKKYCTDASNLRRAYLRNRVRQDIMAGWQSCRAKNSAVKLAASLGSVDDFFEARLNFLARRYSHFVPRHVWESWPVELQFRFFARKTKENGFRQQIEKKHFEKILPTKDCKLQLGESFCFKDKGGFYFYSDTDMQTMLSYHFKIRGIGACYLSQFGMVICLGKIAEKKNSPVSLTTALQPFYLNADKIKFPITISYAKTAETFIPFSKKTPVKLKDFYQSRSIPQYQRLFWPVLRDEQGEIIAIPGVEISERLRIRGNNSRVILLGSFLVL
ncbi:MAG: tRNA lysidine(34) synthetase TilS [Deltaproteobacteria bacterium]|nr:tRNA lysidine(34) synthetase TilS [Deltaproteobacteria bacterium]